MDNLFKSRVLTTAVNEMQRPNRKVYNRIFAGKEHAEMSDRLAFDVITGSQTILKNISVAAPATVADHTGRRTVTLSAPRIAEKRFVATASLNAARAYGQQFGVELMRDKIAREQRDMLNKIDRTLEFWAVNALKGTIYDSDMTTELVDYGVDSSHVITLTGDNLWTSANSDPVTRLRAWKKTIEDDAQASITEWVAFMGSGVMDALLAHADVRELLRYDRGSQIAETGRISRLSEVELNEHNGFYLDSDGETQRFIDSGYILLIGLCDDVVDVPYAPIVDDDAPGGVGNVNAGGEPVMMFSKSWKEQDPSGRWIKVEARPLPVLQRPGCVIYAKAA